MHRSLLPFTGTLIILIAFGIMPVWSESNQAALRLSIEIESDTHRADILKRLDDFADQHDLAATDDSQAASKIHGRATIFRVYQDKSGAAIIVSDIKSQHSLGIGVHVATNGPNTALDDDLLRYLRKVFDEPFTVNPRL